MAKKGPGAAGKQKKSLQGKRNQIEKMIEQSEKTPRSKPKSHFSKAQAEPFLTPTRPIVKVPTVAKAERSLTPYATTSLCRRRAPKATVSARLSPQASKADYLILDRRTLACPDLGLIHLPKEPDIPRPKRQKPKGNFNFLGLPGEIRNQIYNYVIQEETYAVDWEGETSQTKRLSHRLPYRPKSMWPQLSVETVERRKTLRKHIDSDERKKLMKDFYSHSSPVSLLFVCQKIYPEAATVFYSTHTFAFDLLGSLRFFLNTVSPANKAAIRSIAFTYKTYGYPKLTKDQHWKDVADSKWDGLCWRVSDECTSLKHLILNMKFRRSPLRFPSLDDASRKTFGQRWICALWPFEDIGLETFYLKVQSDIYEDAVMAVHCWRIRQEILARKWNEKVENTRDWFGTPLIKTVETKKCRIGTLNGNALILSIDQYGQVS